ncbi:SusD/RagB family nutrient-binding outer membrane lipoprotein [Xanthocytophaga agilis]|uniref:SusD/RagB family nutrient-binding outer membrane lipoprotein n=1 Tax=Xanthocytophaga agilis TaxID=3048010 RepID=A0AAE3UK04_9BACT|nr:SusD/RagB family nutrient-binding outer membrane lipoprotein [Xanthocytophaga agilis]MDJ1506028.1 SusD/RagB family nutrient-binding outer membrane lipoprotein [Xanthocytophaga agilis]
MLVFCGCENQLEEKFNNPEQSSSANLPGLLTGILDNDRVRPSYWNVRTFLLQHPAVYSQTAFFSNSTAMYQHNDSYIGQYWSNFYVPNSNGSGVIALYRSMENVYNSLAAEEKANQEIFMQAARIVLYDQASQMIDLWGDIPFSEAGSLESSSVIANPKFDDQVELYNIILAGLKESAAFFGDASSNASFTKADILLSGSLTKWQRYANSIRLRLLMRISKKDEATARTAVLEMLNNGDTYPLVDGGNAANYAPGTTDILLKPLTTYTANLNSALTELPSYYAPDYMLNTLMKPADDPRIPVMFDKFGVTSGKVFTPNKEYAAMPITFTASEQENNFQKYSILDSATFLQNPGLPGIVITASEVNFLKAEAYQRWGSTADAKTAYETALKQSVTFYYYLNSLNTTGLTVLAKPADSEITTFATTSTAAYTGDDTEKLAKIWNQKWLHLGFLQSKEAWAEYRRTNYPQLTFPTATLANYTTPPTRLVYPSTETTYNTNYKDVQAKDTRTTKIFWDVD